MNRKEATLTLAKDLVKNGFINVIEDDTIKNHLLTNAMYHERIPPKILEQTIIEETKTMYYLDTSVEVGEVNRRINERLKSVAKELQANYLFAKVSTTTSGGGEYPRFLYQRRISITPFAIITWEEIEPLREIHKGQLTGQILEAAEILGIEKRISIEYVMLYKENQEQFKRYFEEVNPKKKAEVIKQILGLKERNSEIDAWLTSQYSKLVTAVGRDRISMDEDLEYYVKCVRQPGEILVGDTVGSKTKTGFCCKVTSIGKNGVIGDWHENEIKIVRVLPLEDCHLLEKGGNK